MDFPGALPPDEADTLQKGFGVYEPGYPYFITCSVIEWLPVFLSREYCDIIIKSLKFCRENKGLLIYGYVIMPTHIHLIVSSEGDLASIIRDFKSFTAKQLKRLLEKDGNHVFLWALSRAAEMKHEKGEQSFWQDGFHPEMIYSKDFFEQKLGYIHANPLRKGLARIADGWQYSSAAACAGETDVPLTVDYLDI